MLLFPSKRSKGIKDLLKRNLSMQNGFISFVSNFDKIAKIGLQKVEP